MRTSARPPLARRERQIMDLIYRLGRATAADVADGLSDPPGYSAIRALLRVLETKGHLKHEVDGPRYVYVPTVPRERARESALRQLVNTFFDGSSAAAAAALLDLSDARMDQTELKRLATLVAQAKKEGR
ncbi:MAG TPA: BlaI/MecI/CopY family transcriptional regulator [Gemmatimonadales bacterium]|nr:BlaI/MecI/CopY family transcriptional regulator [Gemmatimonadales bacterium]